MAASNSAAKPSFFKRFCAFWVRLALGIARAFKNMFYELKKVTWPTRRELFVYTGVTIGFMVVMGVIIYLIDLGSGALVDLLLSI